MITNEQPPIDTPAALREYLSRMILQINNSIRGLEGRVIAAYGGVRDAASTSLPDLGATWQTITAFDTAMVTDPKGIVQDTANGALILPYAGVYSLNVNLSISHDEVNAGRSFFVRLINTTSSFTSFAIEIGTGRNVGVSNVSIAGLLLEIASTDAGNDIQVQIGNGDAYTTVVLESGYFTAHSVSERKYL